MLTVLLVFPIIKHLAKPMN